MKEEEQIISCCGVVCSDCIYFGQDCRGCPAIEGNVFWLEYTGGSVCSIYDCCINEKKLRHCGLCEELPCSRYELEDPTISKEENEKGKQMQLQLLRKMTENDRR